MGPQEAEAAVTKAQSDVDELEIKILYYKNSHH
jgi:hypothetical protein